MNTFQKIALVLSGFSLGVAGTAGAVLKGSAVFSDVPSGAYYDAAIGDMYNAGIIKGYDGTNKFGPDDYVTRGQVAVMLQRFRQDLLGEDISSSSSRSSRSTSSSSSSTSSASNRFGAFRFATASFSIDEREADITVTVIRGDGKDEDVSVEYEVTAGTATADADFEISSGTLNFAEDETTKTFKIAILDDDASEGTETINVKLLDPTNGSSLGTPNTLVVTIKASDGGSASSGSSTSAGNSSSNPKGTLNFSAVEYQVAEDSGTLTVTVERTGGSSSSVDVQYATSNGTADSDEFGSTSGTLSFGNGETTKTFTVTIHDNDSVNGNKTFNLTLSEATNGASLGNQKTAKVSITDDEVSSTGSGSLRLEEDEYEVIESDGKVEIMIERIGGAAGEISVNYATQNGTAKSGTDYTEKSGTLTFKSGESQKVVTIPILADESDPGEAFSFHITSHNGSLLDSPTSASIQIQQ